MGGEAGFSYDHLLIQIAGTAVVGLGALGIIWRTWVAPERAKMAELVGWRREMTLKVQMFEDWKKEHAKIVNDRFGSMKGEVAELRADLRELALGQIEIKTLLQTLLERRQGG